MGQTDTDAVGTPRSGRNRVLDAADGLLSRSGVRAVGVDTITAEADVAEMTLYRNFASKNGLAIAFLALREERWTQGWVRAEISRRADTPPDSCWRSSRSSRSGSSARTSRAAPSSRRCWSTTTWAIP